MDAEGLRALQKAAGWTQPQMAAAMGVPLRTYEDLVRGRNPIRPIHEKAALYAVEKAAPPPQVYDFYADLTRTATQADVDALAVTAAKMGSLRTALLRAMSDAFPALVEELGFGSAMIGMLNRDFYRANGRQPSREERREAFAEWQIGRLDG